MGVQLSWPQHGPATSREKPSHVSVNQGNSKRGPGDWHMKMPSGVGVKGVLLTHYEVILGKHDVFKVPKEPKRSNVRQGDAGLQAQYARGFMPPSSTNLP